VISGIPIFGFRLEARHLCVEVCPVFLARACERRGDGRKLVLATGEKGQQLTRTRECQECQHAIGFDLEQPLQRAAGLPLCEVVVNNQESAEAIGTDTEICEGYSGPSAMVAPTRLFPAKKRAETAS
jgi:hypothetical protein